MYGVIPPKLSILLSSCFSHFQTLFELELKRLVDRLIKLENEPCAALIKMESVAAFLSRPKGVIKRFECFTFFKTSLDNNPYKIM